MKGTSRKKLGVSNNSNRFENEEKVRIWVTDIYDFKLRFIRNSNFPVLLNFTHFLGLSDIPRDVMGAFRTSLCKSCSLSYNLYPLYIEGTAYVP